MQVAYWYLFNKRNQRNETVSVSRTDPLYSQLITIVHSLVYYKRRQGGCQYDGKRNDFVIGAMGQLCHEDVAVLGLC